MIYVSHAEMKMLRAGSARTVEVPAGDPVWPATSPEPPVAVERSYLLRAKATDEFKRESLRALVLALELDEERRSWRVTFRAGVQVEQPRYLRARPGRSGDYTTVEALAAPDEPEPVDEAALKRFEKDARLASQVRVDAETRDTRDLLRRAIDELSSRTDLGEPAARRLANMRRELARLESDLRRAA